MLSITETGSQEYISHALTYFILVKLQAISVKVIAAVLSIQKVLKSDFCKSYNTKHSISRSDEVQNNPSPLAGKVRDSAQRSCVRGYSTQLANYPAGSFATEWGLLHLLGKRYSLKLHHFGFGFYKIHLFYFIFKLVLILTFIRHK